MHVGTPVQSAVQCVELAVDGTIKTPLAPRLRISISFASALHLCMHMANDSIRYAVSDGLFRPADPAQITYWAATQPPSWTGPHTKDHVGLGPGDQPLTHIAPA